MNAVKGRIRTLIRRHGVRDRKPMRQRHAPDALCAYVSPEAIDTAARRIAERVRMLRRDHGGTVYVFVTPRYGAIVLGELHTALPEWLEQHADWLIGCYVADRRTTTMLPAMIEDDLAAYIDGVEANRHSGMLIHA